MLALGASNPAAMDACTLELKVGRRPSEANGFLIVRATRDSVSDGAYYGMSPLRRTPWYPTQPVREVWAQVFEVVSATGRARREISGAERIAAVWWDHDHACQRWLPKGAIRFPEGEMFLAMVPRDPHAWPSGIPTFDLDVADGHYRYYAPALDEDWAARNDRRPMTAV